MSKRTFQPKIKKMLKKQGFRKKMQTKSGQGILNAKRRKGREQLTAGK